MSNNDSEGNKSDEDNSKNICGFLSKGCQSFFKKFIWKIIYNVRLKNYEYLTENDILREFIKELEKPKLKEFTNKGKKKFNNIKGGKDISKIAMFIDLFPQMKRFLSFYYIEEIVFHRACNNFSYFFIEEKSQIFDETHSIRDFYLLIKGRVLVRYEKRIINQNFYDNDFVLSQREKCINDKTEYLEKILTEGDFFSQIIKVKGYTLLSVKILEDSDFAYMDNVTFEKIFEKNLGRFEKEKRSFILRTMKSFRELPPNRLDLFIEQIETKILEHNEIVYCEGEIATSIHLIYYGSFELQVKEFNKLSNLDKINIGKERLKTVLKLERGNVAGLETYEKDSLRYIHTLKVISPFGVVFSIKPSNLSNDALKKLENFIQKIKINKSKIMENLITNNNILNKKLKIKYQIDETNRLAKNFSFMEYIQFEMDKKVKGMIKEDKEKTTSNFMQLPKNIQIQNVAIGTQSDLKNSDSSQYYLAEKCLLTNSLTTEKRTYLKTSDKFAITTDKFVFNNDTKSENIKDINENSTCNPNFEISKLINKKFKVTDKSELLSKIDFSLKSRNKDYKKNQINIQTIQTPPVLSQRKDSIEFSFNQNNSLQTLQNKQNNLIVKSDEISDTEKSNINLMDECHIIYHYSDKKSKNKLKKNEKILIEAEMKYAKKDQSISNFSAINTTINKYQDLSYKTECDIKSTKTSSNNNLKLLNLTNNIKISKEYYNNKIKKSPICVLSKKGPNTCVNEYEEDEERIRYELQTEGRKFSNFKFNFNRIIINSNDQKEDVKNIKNKIDTDEKFETLEQKDNISNNIDNILLLQKVSSDKLIVNSQCDNFKNMSLHLKNSHKYNRNKFSIFKNVTHTKLGEIIHFTKVESNENSLNTINNQSKKIKNLRSSKNEISMKKGSHKDLFNFKNSLFNNKLINSKKMSQDKNNSENEYFIFNNQNHDGASEENIKIKSNSEEKLKLSLINSFNKITSKNSRNLFADWGKTAKNSHNIFNSGSFILPLFSTIDQK